MSFAEGYRAMDWSQVIFSDEKIFWGNGFCGQTWVRLWAVLAREVEKTPCSTVEELGHCVLRVWKDASQPLMKKLVASMPQRIEAVIEVAGAHTKY